MLKTSGLKVQYSRERLIVFPDIELKKGEQLLVHGPSGSGKTSLLNLLSGLLKPTEGKISLQAVYYHQLSSIQMDHFRGKHIGICLQRPQFIPSLNVLENLQLVLYLAQKQMPLSELKSKLDSLSLGKLVGSKVNQLSPGEQQRLMLLRAIIHEPELILADEPSSSLDDRHAEEMIQILLEQCKSLNSTLIVVSHDARIKSRFEHQILLA